jgi:ABC-2 type transport system ATP-binding protein
MAQTERKQATGTDDSLLRAAQVRKVYRGSAGEITAVDGISLDVSSGEVVGLLGPNGAGKTTLIKCCLGIVSPTDGEITVNGVDPFDSPRAAYRSVAAMLEGARNVYWRLTVRENLRFFAGLQGRRPTKVDGQCDRVLRRVGLTEKADEVARNLSRGMKQKLSLACVLIRDTPLLFLDEPTLGLDVEAKEDLKDEITRLADEEHRGLVVCSHDMDTIRDVCDRVVIVNDGRVVTRNKMDALLDAFQTSAYRLEFAETGDVRSGLDSFRTEWHGERLDVTVPDNKALYNLMEQLRACDAVVDSIETVQPDLGEIFLEITDETGQTAGRQCERDIFDGDADYTAGVKS